MMIIPPAWIFVCMLPPWSTDESTYRYARFRELELAVRNAVCPSDGWVAYPRPFVSRLSAYQLRWQASSTVAGS